ncbi:MAG: carboxypeptidase regulatory-like domain-containing protein [Thermodesulfobacteriota bacterium]
MKRNLFFSIALFLSSLLLCVQTGFAQSVEVSNGVAYLVASQNGDGSWGNFSANTEEILATTTVLEALDVLGETGSAAHQSGSSWLSGQNLVTTSHLSRRILANSSVSSDSTELVSLLDDMRKAWGGAEDYDVNILDTALALQALKRTNPSDVSTIGYTLNFLLSNQNSDGGWGFFDNSESNTYITAVVSLALQQFKEIYNLNAQINSAKIYLLSQQNGDGGFGSSLSTIHETALSLLVLLDSHLDSQEMVNALQHLKTTQTSDGSWLHDPFYTALALMALDGDEKAHLPPPPAAISGTVVDAATGQPLAGVGVLLGGVTNSSTSTLPDGSFEFSDLTAGDYSLQFELGGYQSFNKAISVAASESFDLGQLTMARVVIQVTAIKGTVSDAESGQPLAGAVISITGSKVFTTVTDQNGYYVIAGLNPGGVVIVVSNEGYLTVSASTNVKSNQTILFSPALTIESTTPPPDTGDTAGLTGIVTDFDTGEVLAGIEVTTAVAGITETTLTDTDGRFVFSALPAGTAYVTLSAVGFTPISLTTELQDLLIVDLGQLRMQADGNTTLLPDLVVESIDLADLRTELASLELSGTLNIGLVNQGNFPSSPASVLAYYDANKSGSYESNADIYLGVASSSTSLDSSMDELVSIQVQGTLPYRDAPISVWADSGNHIEESNEANNNFTSSILCQVETAPVGSLDPVLKWHWSGSDFMPGYNQVMSTPAVVQLTDDNGDGKITALDIPDVVFVTFAGYKYSSPGVLRAISGIDGAEIWNYAYTNAMDGPAAGDIDNDGIVEIIISGGKGILCIENDGTLKWDVPSDISRAHPALADIDHDGNVEIVSSSGVFNGADGTLLWKFDGGELAPLVADVDLDGFMEVFARGKLYDKDGNILWDSAISGTKGAVGNFDDDDYPEIAARVGEAVQLFEHDGQVKWGPVKIPGGGGGPLTIADVDGDGKPEIGVAGASRYVVFETDGTIKWQSVTQDYSSRSTGSSVFDFEGDGKAELLYGDEHYFRIYDGETGNTLFSKANSSGTIMEYPLVVDLDNDNHAEIVLVSNDYAWGSNHGIRVFEGVNDDWAPTRSIWNQHSYHITNINDDGTIPQYEEPSWLTHNTYRLNTFGDRDALDIPDLSAAMLRVIDQGLGVFDLTARIGNGGTLAVSQNIAVSFYEGDPAAGGKLLGIVDLAGLGINSFADATLVNVTGITGLAEIYAAVDLYNLIDECDEFNNRVQTDAPQIWPDLEVSNPQITDNGSSAPLSVSFEVRNVGALASPDQTMVAFYNGDPLQGGGLLGTMNISGISPGEMTSVSFADLSGIDANETLFVVADANDQLQEYSECNNTTDLVISASDQGLLALATDKMLYGSDEDVSISASITNTGALSGEFIVRLNIEDSNGFLVQELAPVSTDTIPGGEILTVNATWNTSSYIAGGYQVRGYLDSSVTSGLHETTASFAIGSSDPQIPLVTLRTTTNKITYNPAETVVIHDLLINQSSNAIIDDTVLTVNVSTQTGISLFTKTTPVGQLLPNMHKELSSLLALSTTPAGHYTVSGKLTSIADGTLLVEDSTTFEVLGSAATGIGLSGSITADAQVYMGRELPVDYSVTNNGNEDINNLDIRVLVINPATDELFQTLENVIIPLSKGSTYNAGLAADTAQLPPDVYMAVLTASSPSMGRAVTLDSVNFEVLPSLEVSTVSIDAVNLLVWANDKCSTHEDDLEECVDYQISCDVNCIRLDLLKNILDYAVDNYLLVSDRSEFERELRSPFFTDIMILGDHHPLTDHLDEELREKVYSGTGLISSLWANHASAEEIFGMKVAGKLANDCSEPHTVQTVGSPLTVDDSITVKGRVHRVTALDESQAVAGWIADEQGNSREDNPYPAIVLSEYGIGKAVYYAFDLGLTLDDVNFEQLDKLVVDAIAYVHTPVNTGAYGPYQMMPVTTRIKSLGGSFNVRLTDIYAEELSLYDQLTGSWVTDTPKVTDTLLGVDEQLDLTYFVLMPEETGVYSITTEVGFVFNDEYTLFDTVFHEVSAGLSSQELLDDIDNELARLKAMVKKSSKIKIAINHFIKARDRLIYERVDIEKNIHDLEKAIAALLSEEGVEVSAARLMLDRLLRIEQRRWYFHVQ